MKFTNDIMTIAGSPIGESPLPKFRAREPGRYFAKGDFPKELLDSAGVHFRVLPYTVQDRFSRELIPLKLKRFTLENEYLKAEFLPEYGGRLHSLYDKVAKRDLLFTNTVIRPCNLAIRNAWLSGGIEWNIGSIGHTFTTCDNVFCAKLEDGEGNTFIRIYEFERLKSLFWQIDFHLPEGSRELITHVKIVNPFPTETTTYWWTNVAAPDNGNMRVLASAKQVISFTSGTMRYETLPNLVGVKGDPTSPNSFSRSYDYFIQPTYPEECTWEAAVYDDGVSLFERSTPPLSYKKLYVWGVHRAGQHWQDFLSEEGKGNYVEIQAGIAPSQLHDMVMPKNHTYEWTQVFGGVKGDTASLYNKDHGAAVEYLDSLIDERVSARSITELNEKLKKLAAMPVKECDLIHTGAGYGALEIKRMAKDGDGTAPESMLFPTSTIGKNEAPWLSLIDDGKMPEQPIGSPTPSFMISDKWLPDIKGAAEGGDWLPLLHYGIAVFEGMDNTKIATKAYSEADRDERFAVAEDAWLRSIEAKPSYIAYRCLGVLEEQRGNLEKCNEYYALAMKQEGATRDFALTNEYIKTLTKAQEYEKAWQVYSTSPEHIKGEDIVKISVSFAAVRLDKTEFLDEFFATEHATIREGDNDITDVWFEFCAKKMAKERGIIPYSAEFDALIDEAWEKCEPDIMHDFRQSYNRNDTYRL